MSEYEVAKSKTSGPSDSPAQGHKHNNPANDNGESEEDEYVQMSQSILFSDPQKITKFIEKNAPRNVTQEVSRAIFLFFYTREILILTIIITSLFKNFYKHHFHEHQFLILLLQYISFPIIFFCRTKGDLLKQLSMHAMVLKLPCRC
jgi:hypothetical protein